MKKSILFCLGLLSLAPAWGIQKNGIQDEMQTGQEKYQETDQEMQGFVD